MHTVQSLEKDNAFLVKLLYFLDFLAAPTDLIIGAIVDSNTTRKDFIADSIIRKIPRRVDIYRLVMKSGSDNFPCRDSFITCRF